MMIVGFIFSTSGQLLLFLSGGKQRQGRAPAQDMLSVADGGSPP